MAFDKVIDSAQINSDLTTVADAIRKKSRTSDVLDFPNGFAEAISSIETGGNVPLKDVNFYDYEGTRLYSYTVAQAQALTELPPLPEHSGLICQGWNWTLEEIKSHNREVDVGATYITDDGATRIYIHLHEGRTSPRLGIAITNGGQLSVDWGDGTEPEILLSAGNNTVAYTPAHHYAKAGDYVISLYTDDTATFYYNTTGCALLTDETIGLQNNGAYIYRECIRKVELGLNIRLSSYSFMHCFRLSSITIPKNSEYKSIGSYTFKNCPMLSCVIVPSGTTAISNDCMYGCKQLSVVSIPNSVTELSTNVFYNCYCLSRVSIPKGVNFLGTYVFKNCTALESLTLPEGITRVNSSVCSSCESMVTAELPNSILSIDSEAFRYCYSLVSLAIPASVKSIAYSAFQQCYSVKLFDFTKHSSVPSLGAVSAFDKIPADCEIRVPASLYDEWVSSANWSSLASYIVAV